MTRLPRIRNPLLRRELPWLVAEVVLLLILFNGRKKIKFLLALEGVLELVV